MGRLSPQRLHHQCWRGKETPPPPALPPLSRSSDIVMESVAVRTSHAGCGATKESVWTSLRATRCGLVGVSVGWWVCQLSGGCQLDSYSHFYFSLAYQGRNIWSVAVNYDQTLVVSWLLEQHMQLNDHGHMVVPPAKVCAAVNPHPPHYCPTPRPQEEGIAVFA